ncbi:putative phage tail protein [Citrobacter freundii]|uniref:putative phage tail protein n=1 Tax=Citrobacter freundii TaxID=546 RepID=UPI001FFE089C|nr:putative phage tail protein [Citrobacter freundii]
MLPEMRPETTFMLLEEWEEYLELPECGQLSGTVEDRRRAVVEKYHRKGGLSRGRLKRWLPRLDLLSG